MYNISNNNLKKTYMKIKSKGQNNINVYRNLKVMNDPAFVSNKTLKSYINTKLNCQPLQNKQNKLIKRKKVKSKEAEKNNFFILTKNFSKTKNKKLKDSLYQETSSNDNMDLYTQSTSNTFAQTFYKNPIIKKINSPKNILKERRENKSAKNKQYCPKNNSFIVFNHFKKLQNKSKYDYNAISTCFSTSTENYTNLCSNINNQLSFLNSIINNTSSSFYNSNKKILETPISKIKVLKSEISNLIKINKNRSFNKNGQNPMNNNNNLEDKLQNLQKENNILKERIQNSNNQISLLERKIEKLLKNGHNNNSKETQCPIPMPYVKRYSHEFEIVDKFNNNSNKGIIINKDRNMNERNVYSPLVKTNNMNSMKNTDIRIFPQYTEYKFKDSVSLMKNNILKKNNQRKKIKAKSKGF